MKLLIKSVDVICVTTVICLLIALGILMVRSIDRVELLALVVSVASGRGLFVMCSLVQKLENRKEIKNEEKFDFGVTNSSTGRL